MPKAVVHAESTTTLGGIFSTLLICDDVITVSVVVAPSCPALLL